MKKVIITKFDGRECSSGDLYDSDVDAWIEKRLNKNTWGYPERHIVDKGGYDARLIIKKYIEINEGTLEEIPMVHLKAEYEIVTKDITSVIQEQQAKAEKKEKIKAKREKIEAGLDIFAYMAHLNEEKGLTGNQIDQILTDSDIQLISMHLQFGRLARAKTLIENYDVDGILITENDVTEILNLINEHL